jgi:hypothetical protein
MPESSARARLPCIGNSSSFLLDLSETDIEQSLQLVVLAVAHIGFVMDKVVLQLEHEVLVEREV